MENNLLELFMAADQLSVSVSTVKRYISKGMIEAVDVSAGDKYKAYRIPQKALDNFRNARKVNEP